MKYVTKKHLELLPNFCYQKLDATGELIIIKKGEEGYFPCNFEGDYEVLNEGIGVTKEQAQAMKMGSMFGWKVKGSNPNNWKGCEFVGTDI